MATGPFCGADVHAGTHAAMAARTRSVTTPIHLARAGLHRCAALCELMRTSYPSRDDGPAEERVPRAERRERHGHQRGHQQRGDAPCAQEIDPVDAHWTEHVEPA